MCPLPYKCVLPCYQAVLCRMSIPRNAHVTVSKLEVKDSKLDYTFWGVECII